MSEALLWNLVRSGQIDEKTFNHFSKEIKKQKEECINLPKFADADYNVKVKQGA